ncbi:MAG: hypothetical protein ABR89_11405 [Rhodobacter sp. BACL10 MAG-120910-bin24]|nr:MAG: hypothetical protein ABR89_11405 [Rhodobacter sp. BACL10 MAG-120910-bin24]
MLFRGPIFCQLLPADEINRAAQSDSFLNQSVRSQPLISAWVYVLMALEISLLVWLIEGRGR